MTLHVRRTVDNRHQGELNALFGRKSHATVATAPLVMAESTGTPAGPQVSNGVPQAPSVVRPVPPPSLADICKRVGGASETAPVECRPGVGAGVWRAVRVIVRDAGDQQDDPCRCHPIVNST